MPLYVILALVTVVTLGIGLSLWKYGVPKRSTEPGAPRPETTPRQKVIWLLGFVLTITGIVCNAAALAIGEISVVQPIYTLHVLFVMVIGTRYLGESLKLREWVSGLCMIAGAIMVVFGPQALRVNALNVVGDAPAAHLEAAAPEGGAQYLVTDGGTLQQGQVAVQAGDIVEFDGEAGAWRVLIKGNGETPLKKTRVLLSSTTPLVGSFHGDGHAGKIFEFDARKGEWVNTRKGVEENTVLAYGYKKIPVYVMFGISIFLVVAAVGVVRAFRSVAVSERLLGIVAGVFFGTTIICFKIATVEGWAAKMATGGIEGSALLRFGAWFGLAGVTQVTGLLIINSAFRLGRASVIIPLKTTALTLYPVLGGIAIFGEPPTLAKMIGVAFIVLGTAGLVTGSSPAPATGDSESPAGEEGASPSPAVS